MIRYPMMVIAALFPMVSILTVPSASVADKGSSTTSDVRANLVPCCGNPEPNAAGEAERKTQTKSGTVKSDVFSADIEIPVPSAGLGITDATTADIRLVLSRGGENYAECFLALDDDSDANIKSTRSTSNDDNGNDDEAGAEFQVKIQLKSKNGTPVLTQSKGQCDVDLGKPDVQPGVPSVEAGDVATASVVDSSAIRTLFLQGTFVQH